MYLSLGNRVVSLIGSDDFEVTTLASKYASRRLFTVASETEPPSTTSTTTTSTPRTTRRSKASARRWNQSRLSTNSTSTTESPTTSTTTTTTMKTTTTTTLEAPTTSTSTTSTPETAFDCGTKVPESNSHPWIVTLEHSDPATSSKRRTFSKGVLISDRHVLTTVSSIHNSHPFWEV